MSTMTSVVRFGPAPGLRITHLLLIPYILLAMFCFDWHVLAVTLGSLAMIGLLLYSVFFAQTRQVTIDPKQRLVCMERKRWGIFVTQKRHAAFAEFSAVRYHTYDIILEDNWRDEVKFPQLGLYLVLGKQELWRLGDSGASRSEPKYYRNTAVTVAQMMGLTLMESDDEPWAYKPKIKKTTLFSEQANPDSA